ncbi:hypothetical protein QL965_002319 [Escherichia coli]|nr:hypothetical protein [Escherichia coli]
MTATEQLFFLTAEGIHTPYGLLDINKALEMLDEGCFDEPIWHGLEIVCCISEAEEKGMTGELALEKTIMYWRWLYTAMFFSEQLTRNGWTEVLNENGGTNRGTIYTGQNGGMTIYLKPLRLAMQNYMEWALIETYGEESGLLKSIFMYKAFMGALGDDERTGITTEGYRAMHMILDGLICEVSNNSEPETRVFH